MKKFLLPSLFASLLLACSHPQSGSQAPKPVAESNESLVAVLISLAAPEDSRFSADAKLAARPEAAEARISALEQILYASGHSDAMRAYAMDQLAKADPSRAGKLLALYLPRMESDPVIIHACEVALQLGDPRLIDPLIRSYDQYRKRGAADNAPQVKPIETLTGKNLVAALKDRILNSRDTSARVAAMDSLAARAGQEQTKKFMGQPRADADPFTADLQWYVTSFDHLPAGAQETAWARQLHKPQYASIADRVLEIHRTYKREKDYSFAPRFTGALAAADSLTLRMSRAEIEEYVSGRLASVPHARREPNYDKAADDKNETFAANRKMLSRGDLIVIKQLLGMLSDPGFRRQLHALGLEDLSDTTTEHGGMLKMINGRGQVEIFPPLYPANDQAYIASDKLMAAVLDGIAPFHFHFHQINNDAFAGPGTGDLEFTRNNATHSVIVTSMGTREFDVDYVTPGGAVVDLGVYTAD